MGTNKKAYYDFLFRCLEMMNNITEKTQTPNLIFVSPPLASFEDRKEELKKQSFVLPINEIPSCK